MLNSFHSAFSIQKPSHPSAHFAMHDKDEENRFATREIAVESKSYKIEKLDTWEWHK